MATSSYGVLDAVRRWSENPNRPDQQQDALRRIVTNGRFDQNDLNELVEFCKVGWRRPDRGKASVLAKRHLPAGIGKCVSISVVSITNVVGVNYLALDQELKLEPKGLSIIHGDKRTGKSGYARILKNVCGARHTGTIEPNAFSSGQPPQSASASIAYAADLQEQPPETWTAGETPHPTISAVRVFDSECASIHVGEKNEVAFRPFGLNFSDELGCACQYVQDIIDVEIQWLQSARDAVPPTTCQGSKALPRPFGTPLSWAGTQLRWPRGLQAARRIEDWRKAFRVLQTKAIKGVSLPRVRSRTAGAVS